MAEKEGGESDKKLTKDFLERWKKTSRKPEGPEESEPPRRAPDDREQPATQDDLDAFLDSLKAQGAKPGAAPTDLEQLLAELEQEAADDATLGEKLAEVRKAAEAQRAARAAAQEEPEEEPEHEIEEELELPALAAAMESRKGPPAGAPPTDEEKVDEELEPEARRALDELIGPRRGEAERAPKRPAPPRVLPPPLKPPVASPPRAAATELEGGTLPSAGRVNGGRVNGGRVNGGRVNGGRVNGGRVNGGRVNGGRVNGGRVNGGRVNGGRVNGGRVNGGRVNGGRVNGGRVNGGATNGVQALPRRAASRRRLLTAAVAVVALAAVVLPLYSTLFPGAVVRVDGSFGDWASYAIVSDSATDQEANRNIDLVGFAARGDARYFYFYLQFEQGALLFEAPGNGSGADAYRLLIDADRSAGTGYSAFGLGIDFMVVLTGYNGSLQSSELHAFPVTAPDRADAAGFRSVGSVFAAWSANQIEGSVSLRALGLKEADRPLVLVLTQDALGNSDVGDAAVTTLPGVLKITQDAVMPTTLPAAGESRLFTLEAQAEGADVRLLALNLHVESPDGGGVQLTRLAVGGAPESLSAGGSAGAVLRVPIGEEGSQMFYGGSPTKAIEIYGRGTGPNSSVVRIYLRGPQDVETAAVTQATSGLGSILAPSRFAFAYIGEAPPFVKIDGAFADWNQSVPADPDPVGDVRSGLAAPTAGGPNVAGGGVAGLDIVASRAEVSGSARQVSFMLEAAGSIMSPALLPRPTRPVPTQPGTGTPGEPTPTPPGSPHDTAAVYVDTDSNASTGWGAFSGLGIDAVVEIEGTGGGYGRAPRQVQTSISLWNPTAQNFTVAAASLAVGFNSSALETQVSFAALCGASCGAVRYVFFLRDASGRGDATAVRDGTARALGEVLLFDEGRTTTRNVFQGDLHQPVLSFSVTAPSTNNDVAVIVGFAAQLEGATAADIVSLSIYNDSNPTASLDAVDLASPPLAVAPMLDGAMVEWSLASPISMPPGNQLFALLTVDVAPAARAPSWFNVSISQAAGLQLGTATYVRYSFPTDPSPVRILSSASGSRGQNNLLLNEVNPGLDWVEIYDTTNSSTDLTSASQIGLYVYRTNATDVFDSDVAILNLSGTTNSSGFAVFNISVPQSTGPLKTWVALWCNNCSAGDNGTGNNTTFMDSVKLPNGNGMWGRYPDGENNSWQITLSNTSGLPNQIPEFPNPVLTATGAALFVAFAGRFRASKARGKSGRPG